MKYIIIDSNGLESAVIFPAFWDHADTAGLLTNPSRVISAGFIKRSSMGELYVTGGSVSLNLKSRPEDLALIIKSLEFDAI